MWKLENSLSPRGWRLWSSGFFFFSWRRLLMLLPPPNMANLSTFQRYCILLCVIPNLPCKTTPKPLQVQCLKWDILFGKTSCEYFIVRLVINEVASGSKDMRVELRPIILQVSYSILTPPPPNSFPEKGDNLILLRSLPALTLHL